MSSTFCYRHNTLKYIKLHYMSEDKTINLNPNYHTALSVVKKDRGIFIRRTVHIAIQEHFERYYPDIAPILTGGEVDGSKRLEPFRNQIKGNLKP